LPTWAKLAVVAGALAVLAGGGVVALAFALTNDPRAPVVDERATVLVLSWPGASPLEVEEALVPLEAALADAGPRRMSSEAREGRGRLRVVGLDHDDVMAVLETQTLPAGATIELR